MGDMPSIQPYQAPDMSGLVNALANAPEREYRRNLLAKQTEDLEMEKKTKDYYRKYQEAPDENAKQAVYDEAQKTLGPVYGQYIGRAHKEYQTARTLTPDEQEFMYESIKYNWVNLDSYADKGDWQNFSKTAVTGLVKFKADMQAKLGPERGAIVADSLSMLPAMIDGAKTPEQQQEVMVRAKQMMDDSQRVHDIRLAQQKSAAEMKLSVKQAEAALDIQKNVEQKRLTIPMEIQKELDVKRGKLALEKEAGIPSKADEFDFQQKKHAATQENRLWSRVAKEEGMSDFGQATPEQSQRIDDISQRAEELYNAQPATEKSLNKAIKQARQDYAKQEKLDQFEKDVLRETGAGSLEEGLKKLSPKKKTKLLQKHGIKESDLGATTKAATGIKTYASTATNPTTGEKIGWDGQQWVPIEE